MNTSTIICLACFCCHSHCMVGCEIEKHTCTKDSTATLQKTVDATLKEYVQELLKIQKSPGLQTIADRYSRHLAWLQERLDEAMGTKPTELARFNGNLLFYQHRLVGTMNAKLMALFEEQRDTKVQAVPLDRVAEINAQLMALFEKERKEATS